MTAIYPMFDQHKSVLGILGMTSVFVRGFTRTICVIE